MNTAPARDQLFEPAVEPAAYEPESGSLSISNGFDPARSARDEQETASCCNLGATERKVRLALGAGFVAAAAFAPVSRGWRIGFALFGVSQLAMGATRFCPLWHALGVDTLDDRFRRQG